MWVRVNVRGESWGVGEDECEGVGVWVRVRGGSLSVGEGGGR